MKNNLRSLGNLLVVCLIPVLFSCISVQKMQEDRRNARDAEHKAFVQKTDGEVIEANEARLRAPLFGKTAIELDQNVRIPLKEVQAYQNNEAYYYRTPVGFAPRIKKGLINAYLATTYYSTYEAPSNFNGGFAGTRTHVRYVYYLQKGNDGPVEEMKPRLVESYVQDYAPAMEYIDMYRQTQKKVKTWSIVNTAAVIGGLFLITQGISNDKVNALGYASGGLIIGGLVNGFVNKFRKAGNFKNLELAVDEYNHQTSRKRKY